MRTVTPSVGVGRPWKYLLRGEGLVRENVCVWREFTYKYGATARSGLGPLNTVQFVRFMVYCGYSGL